MSAEGSSSLCLLLLFVSRDYGLLGASCLRLPQPRPGVRRLQRRHLGIEVMRRFARGLHCLPGVGGILGRRAHAAFTSELEFVQGDLRELFVTVVGDPGPPDLLGRV